MVVAMTMAIGSNLQALGKARSVLFAPAVRPDFVTRLGERGADLVVIDCEDATPPGAKAEGRANARQLAPDLIVGGSKVIVRINPPATEWFGDDIVHGLIPGLSAVIVPKIETIDQLEAVANALDDAGLGSLGVFAGIETALGVADARLVLSHPRVVAGYFGAEDFIADMAGVRTASNNEVHYARSQVALAARLAGIPIVDQVVTDFGNDDRFIDESAQARALGYRGKLCIHPRQVELANDAFSPSSEELDRAKAMLDAYQTASANGIAAIAFEGQMVDEPLAAQARNLLAAANDES